MVYVDAGELGEPRDRGLEHVFSYLRSPYYDTKMGDFNDRDCMSNLTHEQGTGMSMLTNCLRRMRRDHGQVLFDHLDIPILAVNRTSPSLLLVRIIVNCT
jgi:hypothetical protein